MDEYWIWLSLLKYVGPASQRILLKTFKSPKAIYEADKIDLTSLNINKRALESVLTNKTLKGAENILESVHRKNIGILRLDNPLFPSHAFDCLNSPILLYYLGENLKILTDAVAVVGSRRCTSYGKRVAQEIGRDLAINNIPLISGFAKGIDSYAQASCIQNGGYTIGVLAHGVEICYPKEQRSLYDQMLQTGSIFISQYPPGTRPRPEYFPVRNALISSCSKEVVIVEAEENSGALWTAKFAKKYGREVYAVPNQLGVSEGVGTNRLIAHGLAIPYIDQTSLKSIGKKSTENLRAEIKPAEEHQYLSYIRSSPKSIMEIANNFAKTEESILEELLSLELEGYLVIRGNMVYRK